MKQKYNLLLTIAGSALCLLCNTAEAQREYYNVQTYREKAPQRISSNWMLNVGVGYGNYYGDVSTYRIRAFEDIGKLRNFVNYNSNYISEPSFHLSVAKRLGKTSSGIGLNLNRTLIEGSDRYINTNGNLQVSNPNFARSLNFKTDIIDAGLSLNLNGFTTGFFAPYLSVGAGVTHFTVKGDVFTGPNQNQVYDYNNTRNVNDGNYETNLRDARTETDNRYPNTVLYAQGVLGFNFQITKAFSLAAEADVKYTGSDYLDDVSGRYKTSYPNLREAYIAHPGYNVPNPQTNNRGYNDGVNDFYIQTRVVFRFHLPNYIKRSEVSKQETRFNAPVLYPSNYETTPLDSSAYIRSQASYDMAMLRRQDSVKQQRIKDSLSVRADSLRTDSLAKSRTYNVKMDSAYVNELKALRLELAGLRQAISNASPKAKDSLLIRRQSLKDSLSNNLKKLQDKKKKTATDSLQMQIYNLRLDSIGVAERMTAQKDSMAIANGTAASATVPVQTNTGAVVNSATTSTMANASLSREDSMRRVIDSLRAINAGTRTNIQTNTNVKAPLPSRNTRKTIRDTIPGQLAQQYQQQISGIAYRSSQPNLSKEQRQQQLDSITDITTSLRASDSLRVAYYQAQLAQAQQQEENLANTEKRGLLVKKTDAQKKAKADKANAEKSLQAALTTKRTNEQNARVAAGDTSYIYNLRQQYNARQLQIDSLKENKRALDIFSNKNRRIKELENQQKEQQQQIDDANKMLQYYRNTGPTSYVPQYYQQSDYRRQMDDFNDRLNDLQKQRYALALAQQAIPPVNTVSPVVVSTSNNDDDRKRMQAEIDSLRNQVAALRQTRTGSGYNTDSIARAKPPVYDSSLQRSLAAANSASVQMSAIQAQLAELNSRMNTKQTATPPTPATSTTAPIGTTIYFTRGSAVLSTLQKSKLAATVKKAKKEAEYMLTASSDNTTGNTAANEALARKRAAAVEAYLKVLKVSAANISTTVNANNGEPGGQPDPLAKKVDVSIR